jgi:hypothetical protein
LLEKPTAYLDEMAWFTWDDFSVNVHISTISKHLKEKGWTQKVVFLLQFLFLIYQLEKRTMERSQLLRDEWLTRLMEWSSDQLVFMDESAANERTLDRKYGWSPCGTPARVSQPLKRTERWSILPAYTVHGYIAWDIVKGSFNSESFLEVVREKVLPEMNPFPGPRSVLIMDNARIHHSEVCGIISSQFIHRNSKKGVKKLKLYSIICRLILQILTPLKSPSLR